MPLTTKEALGQIPAGWKPDPCPDLAKEPWDGVDVPWRHDKSYALVDALRTSGLARTDINVPMVVSPPNGVWSGAVTGMPYQVLDPKTKQKTNFKDLGLPPKVVGQGRFLWWTWDITAPVVWTVDMPPVIRREGDPNGAWDQHAYVLDLERNKLIELYQVVHPFNQASWDWNVGYNSLGVPSLIEWDMSKPFTAVGQPNGVIAASFPHMPHFIRYDELKRGIINHAMVFALPNYAPEYTGYARHSDGSYKGHPVRAGERLRLPRKKVETYAPGTPERVIAEALWKFTAVCCDRNNGASTANSGFGSIAIAQDPRIMDLGWKGMGDLKLSDFEVIQP